MLIYRYHRKYKKLLKTLLFAITSLFKFYAPNGKLTKGEQYKKLFNKVKITINTNDRFIYNIDIYKTIHRNNKMLENISIDYSKVLNESLLDMQKRINKLKDSLYKKDELETIEAIELYLNREIEAIKNSQRKDKEKLIKYLKNIKDKHPSSFEECIQRILFFNQLLWQTDHRLTGLGQLDRILSSYYESDLEKGIITKEATKNIIKDMLKILHKHYWWKSNELLGDTGQIIVLGGLKTDKEYFTNDLTYLFIESIKELQLPDPKVLLKVSKKTPRNLIELSLNGI